MSFAQTLIPNLMGCAKLAKLVPNSRGEATSPSTVWRWIKEGRLRSVKVGGRLMSTPEWLLEMFEREASEECDKQGIIQPGFFRSKEAGDRQDVKDAARVGYTIGE